MDLRIPSGKYLKTGILGRFDPELEIEYMDRKFQETRIIAILLGFASASLAVLLWSWDWAIDSASADSVLWSRMLLGAVLAVYPLSILAGAGRKFLPWIYAAAILITEGLFLYHLSLLETGLVYGIAGFMYWFILPVFLGLPYSRMTNVYCFLAVAILPNILVYAGISQSFELIKYNVLIWPTCGIGIMITFMLDQLYRRIFIYRREAEELARFDGLTGIANRRHLMETGDRLLEFCRRHERPISIILFDIDHFKQINDSHGHLVGDKVLRHIAGILQNGLRKSDFPGRYGGEEFVMILPHTTPANAWLVAEKIRRRVENTPTKITEDMVLKMTISAGVSGRYPATEHVQLEDLLKQADDALYQAKRAGRNRTEPVCCSCNKIA
ncbi:MAG: GGDEF domain-containing protein [Desulfobacteraceae bacterium]|jgi:diguanylate cyclase (GGDEF)-like protein|nr:MAG: GGDEF domain-containing protein [Desulfobacteraceae bacterium]